MIFRTATEKDIPKILEIYAPYIENTCVSFEYTVPSLDEFTDRFMNITELFPWLVCENNREILGYAYASKAFARAAYQWDAGISVYINERYHGLGIGSMFYSRIENLLKEMGYINLYAVISGSNKGSIIFHEKCGYDKFAVFDRTGYKFGNWIDTVWYRKILNEHTGSPAFPVKFESLDKETVKNILSAD